jgi:8-oxo-dGTP pyrophosphatase MutT (NUDIX family)
MPVMAEEASLENVQAWFPVSVSAFIFNESGELLLVSPDGREQWQVISGMLKEESVAQGLQREIEEELGRIDFQVLDILDAHTFNYRGRLPIISIFALVLYRGGAITTNDDIEGFAWRWFRQSDLSGLHIQCPQQFELIEKACFLASLYRRSPHIPFLKYKWGNLT